MYITASPPQQLNSIVAVRLGVLVAYPCRMRVNLWHNGMKSKQSYGEAGAILMYNTLFEEMK